MKRILCLVIAVLSITVLSAQDTTRFYATLSLQDAEALRSEMPNDITIIETTVYEAAVEMTEEAGHVLHDRILVHGPGYIRKASMTQAVSDIRTNPIVDYQQSSLLNTYTIDQDATVALALEEISTANIAAHIMELEAYGTRHHNRAQGTQAAMDLKVKWETMASDYGRTDVSVRLFDHVGTSMPSVIMTITGAQTPEEYVITGGHLDTTASVTTLNAPGADDDASGIATITEAARTLFEIDFVPNRTIEFMAYAAEEIGLVGSAEIAQSYRDDNKNVVGVTQFDMTNFNGSANDVYFISDNTDGTLNTYLMQLLDYYNASGEHAVTYSTSLCNYGCSDHASWFRQGYPAAFPFEAAFGDHNSAIHTAGDMFAVSGTANHATKFAKLCTEFLIETAKNNTLSVNDVFTNFLKVSVTNDVLTYSYTKSDSAIQAIKIYDVSGKQLLDTKVTENEGQISLAQLSSGFYIATFVVDGKNVSSKKILIQ